MLTTVWFGDLWIKKVSISFYQQLDLKNNQVYILRIGGWNCLVVQSVHKLYSNSSRLQAVCVRVGVSYVTIKECGCCYSSKLTDLCVCVCLCVCCS